MATTTNYGLQKDAQTDYYNIDTHNANLDIIDETMKDIADSVTDHDSKDNTVTFTEAEEDTNITSGEKHSVLFGKILKSIKTLREGKVDNSRVKTDVPLNAKFTETTINGKTGIIAKEDIVALGIAGTPTVKTATLTTAGWTGSSAPYTQEVTVTGVTASNNVLFDISMGVTTEQYEAAMDAQLKATGQSSNKVTIKAFGDKPTVNIPVQFVILG